MNQSELINKVKKIKKLTIVSIVLLIAVVCLVMIFDIFAFTFISLLVCVIISFVCPIMILSTDWMDAKLNRKKILWGILGLFF